MGAGAGPSTAWSNAFAIVAESNEAFAEAVLKKLVIEITSAEVRKMRLAEMWSRWRPDPETEVSFAGIVYVVGLVAVLLLIHLVQPEREGSGSSSRSPTHQEGPR
jgi:hypothetical protein